MAKVSRRQRERESARALEAQRLGSRIVMMRYEALKGTGTFLAREPWLAGVNIGEQLLGRPGLFK
jgi:hypothetical protein